MSPVLSRHFQLLEDVRKDMISHISSLDESVFSYQYGNKWSIAQILMHVITSETLARQYMMKKLLGASALGDAGVVEGSKLILLKLSQRLPIKYKAPKAIQDKTPAPLPKEALTRAWLSERENLQAFLESIPEKYVKKKIFKHPIAGMFSASQGVAFLREHLLHHKPQIIRLASHAHAR